MDVPPKEDDEKVEGYDDLDYDEMMEARAPEVLLPKLNAAWKTVGSNTVALMDSDGEDCGLFCSALNRFDSYLYGRLIFNEMKQLIGFGVNSGYTDGEELYGVHSQ